MPKSAKPFKKAYLEITNVCNLNCSFCPKTARSPRFIRVEEFAALLEQVTPLTDYVYLHLMGEPLMHPELKQLLALCAQKGLKVSLTTNGTLLRQCQEILLSSPALYRVSISVHSFEANQTGQTLEEYLADILNFCRTASEQTSVYCVLRLWNRDSATLKAQNQRNVDIFEQVQSFFRLPFQHHFGRPSLSGNCRKIFLAHPCPRRPGGFRVLLRTPRPVRCSGGRHRCSLLFGLGGKHPAGQCLPAATCGDSLLSPCQSPI